MKKEQRLPCPKGQRRPIIQNFKSFKIQIALVERWIDKNSYRYRSVWNVSSLLKSIGGNIRRDVLTHGIYIIGVCHNYCHINLIASQIHLVKVSLCTMYVASVIAICYKSFFYLLNQTDKRTESPTRHTDRVPLIEELDT